MATRRILAIIIALALVLGGVFCLSGCSPSEETQETKETELTENKMGGLILMTETSLMGDGIYQRICYDPDTLVMYIVLSTKNELTVTVLYNADGTPKLYNPEK